MRKIELDILKGILIILVVVGHANIKIPHVDLQWFRMPVFFMATGYLTKKWLSLQSFVNSRPDQTRPDQTRPDQTRPDQTRPDQTRPDQLLVN